MSRRAGTLLIVLCVVAGAPAAANAVAVDWVPAHPRNYDSAYRPSSLVRLVVVHSIEGSYWGAISWFRNPRARASSNYVVSRTGAVTQMVSERRVAWHAGNGWVNRRSIGVEHEGYAWLRGTFTDTEYRASAQLTASIMRRYVLPVDRGHVIAHAEVRDPLRPWLRGGYGHHTDPGPYWDWRRYMSYVRSYAAGRTPPPPAFDVVVPALSIGQSLRGAVRWEAFPSGVPAARVDFLVDGRVRNTQRQPPYVFGGATGTGWETRLEANGRHRLTARAVAADGRVVESTVVAIVRNSRVAFTGQSLVEGQTVTGAVRWEAYVSGTPVRVEFLVDGVLRDTQLRAPYVFGGALAGAWDTARETPGPHVLTVRAVTRRPAEVTVNVIVAAPSG